MEKKEKSCVAKVIRLNLQFVQAESLLTLGYHAALLSTNHKTDSCWHHITTEDKTPKVDAIQICRTYDKKHLITSIQSNLHYCSNTKQIIFFFWHLMTLLK